MTPFCTGVLETFSHTDNRSRPAIEKARWKLPGKHWKLPHQRQSTLRIVCRVEDGRGLSKPATLDLWAKLASESTMTQRLIHTHGVLSNKRNCETVESATVDNCRHAARTGSCRSRVGRHVIAQNGLLGLCFRDFVSSQLEPSFAGLLEYLPISRPYRAHGSAATSRDPFHRLHPGGRCGPFSSTHVLARGLRVISSPS